MNWTEIVLYIMGLATGGITGYFLSAHVSYRIAKRRVALEGKNLQTRESARILELSAQLIESTTKISMMMEACDHAAQLLKSMDDQLLEARRERDVLRRERDNAQR